MATLLLSLIPMATFLLPDLFRLSSLRSAHSTAASSAGTDFTRAHSAAAYTDDLHRPVCAPEDVGDYPGPSRGRLDEVKTLKSGDVYVRGPGMPAEEAGLLCVA